MSESTNKVDNKKWYDACAGFVSIKIQKGANEFNVTRSNSTVGECTVAQMINLREYINTCGKWHDHNCSCIDAEA